MLSAKAWVTFYGKGDRAAMVKDLEIWRWSCVIQVNPKCNTGSL